ncbi:MAG: nucleotidyltransferase domain-containing protein [Candidatus Omnitrophica bacterium]|nr:nucleotidyltransferase domain-containing protein [Candidatus Omnitrophota bacterium]
MLSGLLGSKTRQVLLNTFFSNPGNEYYTRQLASMHKMSVGTLHREIKKLIFLGILNVREVGNIKLFYLNKQNPVYEELKNIVYKTAGVIKLVQDCLIKINGVKAAFIYGSFAKGEERQDSDIDIFLIGDDIDEDKLVINISNLEKKLFKEINYTRYTNGEYQKEKKKKNSFVLEVIKGKKIFIKGSKDDL